MQLPSHGGCCGSEDHVLCSKVVGMHVIIDHEHAFLGTQYVIFSKQSYLVPPSAYKVAFVYKLALIYINTSEFTKKSHSQP